MGTITVEFNTEDWAWLCEFLSSMIDELETKDIKPYERNTLEYTNKIKHILNVLA